MKAEEIAIKASALSDINRIVILKMLAKKELCACNILEYLGISQPTLSYHMKLLAESGFVTAAKRGKWTFYTLDKHQIDEFVEEVGAIVIAEVEGIPDLECDHEDD